MTTSFDNKCYILSDALTAVDPHKYSDLYWEYAPVFSGDYYLGLELAYVHHAKLATLSDSAIKLIESTWDKLLSWAYLEDTGFEDFISFDKTLRPDQYIIDEENSGE